MSATRTGQTQPFAQKPVVVLGAGIVGCAIAYLLLEAGFKVTVVAEHLPGSQDIYYPSAWAGAAWFFSKSGPEHLKHFQAKSHRILSNLKHKDGEISGIATANVTELWKEPPKDSSSSWGSRVVSGESKFHVITHSEASSERPYKAEWRYTGLFVDPTLHLPYIKAKIEALGGRFIQKRVGSISELYGMFSDAQVFVNASGHGSRTLADVQDETCFLERGQNVLFETKDNKASITEQNGPPEKPTYIIPRPLTGTVILGGVHENGNYSEEIDMDTALDEIRRTHRIAPSTVPATPPAEALSHVVAMRSSRQVGFRLESQRQPDGRNIISAYGFGGSGYCFAYGVADSVVEMVKDVEYRALFCDEKDVKAKL